MTKLLLITRPYYDITTSYLYHWAGEIIDSIKKKDIQILDLKKGRANKKEFNSITKKKQPSFVFLNGHGSYDRVTGQDGQVIIKSGENDELLHDKIVYALSCKSAKKLGKTSIKEGAQSYIGYTDDFVFCLDQDFVQRPLKDETAKLFLKPSNQLVNSIIKGHPVRKACERAKDLFKKNAQKIFVEKSSGESYLIPYLLWDMEHLVCEGDDDAVF